jgi:hypothetical protein
MSSPRRRIEAERRVADRRAALIEVNVPLRGDWSVDTDLDLAIGFRLGQEARMQRRRRRVGFSDRCERHARDQVAARRAAPEALGGRRIPGRAARFDAQHRSQLFSGRACVIGHGMLLPRAAPACRGTPASRSAGPSRSDAFVYPSWTRITRVPSGTDSNVTRTMHSSSGMSKSTSSCSKRHV